MSEAFPSIWNSFKQYLFHIFKVNIFLDTTKQNRTALACGSVNVKTLGRTKSIVPFGIRSNNNLFIIVPEIIARVIGISQKCVTFTLSL